MFFYARADTHFLLYIYDMVRNELVDRSDPENEDENRIEHVLQKSKETSLFRYEKHIYNAESGRGPGGWFSALVKTPALFNNEQFSVFRAVHEWRDQVARADDDNPTYVMPQNAVFTIAKIMPMDMVALLGIAHPVSHGVKSRAGELLELIKTAKAQGLGGPRMMDVLRPDSVGAVTRANLPETPLKTVSKTLVAQVDSAELRSDTSTFWGGAFGSSIWEPAAPSASKSLRLAVPLPALSSEIFQSASSSSLPRRPIVVKPPTPPAQPAPKNEPFVIKRGQSSKRKSDAISSANTESEGDNGYDISLNDADDTDSEAERKAAKAERKRQKKAAKKLARAEKEAGSSKNATEEGEVEEEEAFDYSKAETVLHGKRKDWVKGDKKKKDKPFDPYAKSADAPQGMRRVQTERAGRSHTFKS